MRSSGERKTRDTARFLFTNDLAERPIIRLGRFFSKGTRGASIAKVSLNDVENTRTPSLIPQRLH